MKYGLPYKGSKNKLAERIVSLLPKRTHLIDLFCGGCAVSHAALLRNKYEHIHINDINWMCPTLFIDALNGKYQNETRWISREDFFRLKDTDPYVAVVWSFGNNLRDYLYSKEIEPLKKAIHYAIFFRDYSLGKELGYDLSFIEPISDIQRRYAAVKRYFSQFGHFQQQSFEGGAESSHQLQVEHVTRGGQNHRDCRAQRLTNGSTPTSSLMGGTNRISQIGNNREAYKRPSELQHQECRSRVCGIQKKKIDRANSATENEPTALHRLQYRERQLSLPRNSGGGQFSNITSSVLDYAKVEIPDDSVIYCDIPYEDTNVYNKAEGFDYERFYDWCEHQTQPVFISSYQMPDDRFDCIEEFSHRSTLSATANNLVTERIYVPKHQKERGNRAIQLSLF